MMNSAAAYLEIARVRNYVVRILAVLTIAMP